MILAADYRAKAADCARRAEEAQDDYHRKNFEQLALMWSEMAEKADERAASGVDAGNGHDEIADALDTIKNASTNSR